MTTSSGPPSLTWSSQFSVLPSNETPFLKGDKIILPASALEQLLSAATVTISQAAYPQTSNFDPYNPYTFRAELDARSEIVERRQQLPHPLTFRLVNPQNGRIVFAGIREFSAEDQQIGLSPFLRHSLGIEDSNGLVNENRDREHAADGQENRAVVAEGPSRITVHVKELPKGTFVKLRPLEAGYNPEDWKSLLEKYLRDTFTTLTNGEILTVPTGKDEFRFLVDELKPSNEAVSLVDTDLEVDIEALNEEQAIETLKQRLKKSQRAPGTSTGSSAGGAIELDKEESGQVRPEEYVDYSLHVWDRKLGIEVEVTSLDDGKDIDLFISAFGPRQRSRPRELEHVWGDFSGQNTKTIKIQPSHAELENADALWISVRGYHIPSNELNDSDLESPIQYRFRASTFTGSQDIADENAYSNDLTTSSHEEGQCKNCRQWVPLRAMVLHENFCFRNNVFCVDCKSVFQKSSEAWKNHWHCPQDQTHGNSQASRTKHDTIFHTAKTCLDCGFHAANTPSLAHHRTTICPSKLVLCSFCHLQVPQQGPEDPDCSSPEVVLSGLTPHELSDGARTTECHLCAKIVRLRDMSMHLKHHDLQRLSRSKPRICRNANCGRTLDGVGSNGEIRQSPVRNELAICDTCFGPLYVSMYDPDGKALKRRVERKYLTQLLTGCGRPWCRNQFCKTGRRALGLEDPGQPIKSKEALLMVKPNLETLKDGTLLFFCTDEASQNKRGLAEMMAAEGTGNVEKGKGYDHGKESGYKLEWCVAALEATGGDLDKGRNWLRDWAPTRAEVP